MTQFRNSAPLTRRLLIRGLGAGLLGAAALPAQAFDEWPDLDPTDRIPGFYGVNRFAALSEEELFMVGLAVKRGRDIRIGRYSRSQSRQIVRDALQDWPATRARLLSGER